MAVWSRGRAAERRLETTTGRFGSILGSMGHDPVCPSIIWVRFGSTLWQISEAERVQKRFEPHPLQVEVGGSAG
jgi:hypothetical protein